MKKMIFHIPIQINKNHFSGSQLRPQKMIQAFKDIGYEVELVMGYAKQRKSQISKIKQNINDGVKYDFLYSESSTMPTALTEKHHLPISPFLDFNFFGFCKAHKIKIGLYYRDVYWVFKDYEEETGYFKYMLAKFFYEYDLRQYNKYIDIFYLQSKHMYCFIPFSFRGQVLMLPPGVDVKRITPINKVTQLAFVYVGGLSKLYDLTLFSETVNTFKNIEFNLCTRREEWERQKEHYKSFDNLYIYHKNGDELSEIYAKSSIAVYFIKPDALWTFPLGVKLFEYISYKKPIIAVKNTAVGEFVEKYNIGWVINYNETELKDLIISLQDKPSQIDQKIKNIEKIIPENTWEARALQVQKDLTI